MDPLTYRINDMDCANEAALLSRALLPLVGLESRLDFDLLRRTLRVDISGLLVTPDQIAQAIATTGLRAEAAAGPVPTCSCSCCGGSRAAEGLFWRRRKRKFCAWSAAWPWAAGLILMMAEHGSILAAFATATALRRRPGR